MEIMMFAGLISAFAIVRSGAAVWPPPGQPRLPVEDTAVNTGALLMSGVLLLVANRRFKRNLDGVQSGLLASLILGLIFVGMQGGEWVAMLSQGLTLTSSAHGGFFYLIVGAHGVHAIAGLLALCAAWFWQRKGSLSHDSLWAISLFWYFVVLLWPILYYRVYL
jgi:heme/copper-type cytochrome/quinol oxidase subunit 3